MNRRPYIRVALGAVLLTPMLSAPAASASTIIDSFETGDFSLALSSPGWMLHSTLPNASHCIASDREVSMTYPSSALGPMTCSLVPLSGQDDAMEIMFPAVHGIVELFYDGGPWDLTEGGTQSRISVRVTGGGPSTSLSITLDDVFLSSGTKSHNINGAGTYQFSLSDWYADVTLIEKISIKMTSYDATPLGIQDIRTLSTLNTPLTWTHVDTGPLVYLCGSPAAGATPGLTARGSGNTLSWDWTTAWASPETLAGPVLQVAGVGGPNCSDVTFDASGSGAYGGMVTIDWGSPTFDSAAFDMFFTTDPSAGYLVQPVGKPVITMHGDSFVIGHDVEISDVFGVPDGVVHQELIVSPHPGQELYVDYVDALPWAGGSDVGYSLSFAVTGAAFDPALPLLEMFTTATYSDDAGATGAAVRDAMPSSSALAAHPSVTRSGTRFVLPSDAAERAIVDVFDVAGRRVRRLEARSGEVAWDGAGENGARVPAGAYFGRVEGVAGAARVIVLR